MNLNTQTGRRMSQETSSRVALIVYLLEVFKLNAQDSRLVSYLMMDSQLCLWNMKALYYVHFYCLSLSLLQSKYVIFKYSGCSEINHLVHKVCLLLSLDVRKWFSSPRIFLNSCVLRVENQKWCLAYHASLKQEW